MANAYTTARRRRIMAFAAEFRKGSWLDRPHRTTWFVVVVRSTATMRTWQCDGHDECALVWKGTARLKLAKQTASACKSERVQFGPGYTSPAGARVVYDAPQFKHVFLVGVNHVGDVGTAALYTAAKHCVYHNRAQKTKRPAKRAALNAMAAAEYERLGNNYGSVTAFILPPNGYL